MEAEIQAQLAFHLTGRIGAGELGCIDGRGLLPALFASCRDLTRLRYDFPLVLIPDRVARHRFNPCPGSSTVFSRNLHKAQTVSGCVNTRGG